MQSADRSEVEVQILRVELETFRELVDRLLELHQRYANVLDLFGGQGLFLEPSYGLTLHQFADKFDEAENKLYDRTLQIFGIGIPS